MKCLKTFLRVPSPIRGGLGRGQFDLGVRSKDLTQPGTMFKLYLILGIFLIFCSAVWADIPKQINFQGILKDSLGNPYPDGNYSITFRIYNAASGGNILWQEGQLIAISGGLFTHLLGSAIPIPETVFADSLRWLGIQVAGNPEITPRRQLVSVPYSYVADYAQNAGKLGGSDGSDFVRRTGPDSIISSSTGNAFLARAVGSDPVLLTGLRGVADNSGAGLSYGVRGRAVNSSSGNAYGGYFTADLGGTGVHYGVYGEGFGSSSASTYGSYSLADNTSSGGAYGGRFETSGSGTGGHYAVYGSALGSSSSDAVGSFGNAQNSSTGDAYGGYFITHPSGTGGHFGVYGQGIGSSSTASFGSFGQALNTTGAAYGVYGVGSNSSSTFAVGTYGSADNTSTGNVYGGLFVTASSGTGRHWGVYGSALGSSNSDAVGSFGEAQNSSTGDVYGGSFIAASSGTGGHWGVYGSGFNSSSSAAVGCSGYAENTSTGIAYGGVFTAAPSGTGTHYGVYGVEAAGGSGAAVYAAGDFAGSGAKYAVAKTSKGNRLLSVIEAPEVWFEDFGEGQLVNGKTHINLDPLFLETITINAQNPMKVFIQLNDPDCKGTAVVRGTTGFDVVELQNGTSNASFSYRIVAKRKGYENQRLLQTTLGMDDPNLYPELWDKIEKEQKEAQAQRELERQKVEEERKKMEVQKIQIEQK